MVGRLLATCAANIVVVYLAAIFASSAEGWRDPLKAVLTGSVGGVVYLLPLLLTRQPRGSNSLPAPSVGGMWAALILSFVWYLVAFTGFYGFGFVEVVLALVGMRIAGRLVGGRLEGP